MRAAGPEPLLLTRPVAASEITQASTEEPAQRLARETKPLVFSATVFEDISLHSNEG